MIKDQSYQKINYSRSELEHRYGPQVHILSDSFLLTHLAKLCSPETEQPIINQLVEALYSNLVKTIINCEFPQKKFFTTTRMATTHPQGTFESELIDTAQKAVTVNLARAGTYPSHICYNALNYILDPKNVRQDHISINRTMNQSDQVTGAKLSGHKIGGGIKNTIVLFPDPMGATGSTIISALNTYKKEVEGPAQKFIAVHLIVTPEYLKAVTEAHPELIIYAVRLDRGLSSPKIFETIPGTFWSEEKGLNAKQYIVPGGGGFGEIMNNAFV